MGETDIIISNITAPCAVEGYSIMGAIIPAIGAELFTTGESMNPPLK